MSRRLDFGIILGDVPVAVAPRAHLDGILRQVEAAQRHGFTHICIGHHVLYEGYRWLQPIPLLARLAAETGPDVKLVLSVVVTPYSHPVVLAEELATLDILSGGRLIAGIGAGYRKAEFDLLQIPYAERFRRFEEGLRLMELMWRPEPFDFDGEFWQLTGATPHIPPLQAPRPPIWMGAMRPVGIRRAARLGDAWMITPEMPWWEVDDGAATFAAERVACGLPPARLPIRREIVTGTDGDDALATYEARSRSRYQAYAARGQQELNRHEHDVDDGFGDWARQRAILGTPEHCVAALARIDADRFGPVIVRPSWPGMGTDDVLAYLDALGRDVVGRYFAGAA